MEDRFRETLERYLAERRGALSPVSLKHYRLAIGSFLEFLKRHHPEIESLAALRRSPAVEGWLRMLLCWKPPYTPNTRAHYIYIVRRFFEDQRSWRWPGSPPPGLIQPEDIPPCRRASLPRRRLSGLSKRAGISTEAITLDPWYRLLERYLLYLSADTVPGALTAVRVAVLSLVEFLWRRHPEVDSPEKLRREPHIAGWLEYLAESRHLKRPSRISYIHHLQRFFADLRSWGWPLGPSPGLIQRDDRPRDPRFTRRRNRFLSRIDSPAVLPGEPPPETPLHRTLKRYLEIRGTTLRPATLRHYRLTVSSLIALLRCRFPEVDSFAGLKREPHIETWLKELASVQPPFRNGTRRERIRTLLRFLGDLEVWGWSEAPPPGLIRLEDFPPCDHCLPKPLPAEVDSALLAALRKDGDLLSLGLILARRTGLRVGELSRLELDCLIEDPRGGHSLKVPLGKLRSERVIPIDAETAELIRALRRLSGGRRAVVDPETGRSLRALFTDGGGAFVGVHRFYRKLKWVARSAGITENVHPHRLRHAFATEMLRNGLSLIGVMKLLGHRTIKMTLRYVEVTNEDLGRDYLRAMECARRRYSTLQALESRRGPEGEDSRGTIAGAFDRLVERIQAQRFEARDAKTRKKLQRLVERLRRAQQELSEPPS